jgi:hypothetical protein
MQGQLSSDAMGRTTEMAIIGGIRMGSDVAHASRL